MTPLKRLTEAQVHALVARGIAGMQTAGAVRDANLIQEAFCKLHNLSLEPAEEPLTYEELVQMERCISEQVHVRFARRAKLVEEFKALLDRLEHIEDDPWEGA